MVAPSGLLSLNTFIAPTRSVRAATARAALADVRELMKHLPKGHRERSTWQHVAACLDEAAHGADASDVTVPLKMVLSMEGVPYQLKARRFPPP